MSTLQAPSNGVRAIAAGEPNKYIVRKSAENPARMRLRFIPDLPLSAYAKGRPTRRHAGNVDVLRRMPSRVLIRPVTSSAIC